MADDGISWPESFSDIGKLENYLKCGICYEFMNTALITPCSHNFCSICIRKFMQYRTSCPQCLANVNDIDLKNNRTLDEMVVVMQRLRGPLCQALRGASVPVAQPAENLPQIVEPTAQPSPAKVVHTPKANNIQSFLSPKKPTSSSVTTPVRSLFKSNGIEPLSLTPSSPIVSQVKPDQKIKVRSIASLMRSPMKTQSESSMSQLHTINKSMVTCPICQVEIPENNINFHIDRCLERSNQEVVSAIKPVEANSATRRRLPKLVYDIMKDQELRRKCAELKISTQGDKKTLIKRHKKYTLMYNSECDSSTPRPVSEILNQLEKEEREEMKANSKVFKAFQIDRKSKPEVIENAQAKYRSENKNHFDNLVAQLREREKAKRAAKLSTNDAAPVLVDQPSTSKTPPIEPVVVLSDDEDTPGLMPDSPGTPNSEMDLLLNQSDPVSPVIMKKKVVAPAKEEDNDSLDEMFSQPIHSSTDSKKGKKTKRAANKCSDSDDDIWDNDVMVDKPKRRNSQVESMPLRRSSRQPRKCTKDSDD